MQRAQAHFLTIERNNRTIIQVQGEETTLPDINVGKFQDETGGGRIVEFIRLEVGEGLEKKSENFAEEVMAQVRGD